ncbi:hypothetical protein KCU92_g5275, partial [Aureobasidium melanogenum]
MDPDDGHPKRPVAPHIKYKSAAISAGQSSSKTPVGFPSLNPQHKDIDLTAAQMSRLEELEKENDAQKTALAKLEEENEAQKQALSESQIELQAWKDFHADGPGPWTEYEFQVYLKYPSSRRAPSPQTNYDESVALQWAGGENIHDLLNVQRLKREGETHRRPVLETQNEIDLRTRGQTTQCNHLPPWTDVDGNPVERPIRVSYQDKFGKPGLLTCEDGRGWFCRYQWPSMFHCLKCNTYFCRPCGSDPGIRRPKWIVELEQQYEATHEK